MVSLEFETIIKVFTRSSAGALPLSPPPPSSATVLGRRLGPVCRRGPAELLPATGRYCPRSPQPPGCWGGKALLGRRFRGGRLRDGLVLVLVYEMTEGTEDQSSYPVGGLGFPRVRAAGRARRGARGTDGATTAERTRRGRPPRETLGKGAGRRRSQPVTGALSGDVSALAAPGSAWGCKGLRSRGRATSHRPRARWRKPRGRACARPACWRCLRLSPSRRGSGAGGGGAGGSCGPASGESYASAGTRDGLGESILPASRASSSGPLPAASHLPPRPGLPQSPGGCPPGPLFSPIIGPASFRVKRQVQRGPGRVTEKLSVRGGGGGCQREAGATLSQGRAIQ